jgi:hypothetical protein
MATLSDEQVDLILDDLRAHGIRLEGLRDNLLDHICFLLEDRLETGGDFGEQYAAVIPSFYRQDLYELEEEALFLASLKGPHLVLSRGRFFAAVFAIVVSPYLTYFLQWWLVARPAGDLRNMNEMLSCLVVFMLYPLLTTVVLFLTPDRFDPLIPWRSKILIGFKPFIRILPGDRPFSEPLIG